jgi:hypothetical protein
MSRATVDTAWVLDAQPVSGAIALCALSDADVHADVIALRERKSRSLTRSAAKTCILNAINETRPASPRSTEKRRLCVCFADVEGFRVNAVFLNKKTEKQRYSIVFTYIFSKMFTVLLLTFCGAMLFNELSVLICCYERSCLNCECSYFDSITIKKCFNSALMSISIMKVCVYFQRI